DNDCDGAVDEGNPEGGASCAPAATCSLGEMQCVGGVLGCVMTTLVSDGQDPHLECSAQSCESAGRFAGWSGDVCYFDGATFGDGCDGGGACRTPDQDCLGTLRGAASGSTRGTCETPEGCTGSTPPTTGLVADGRDPYLDCAGGSCAGAGYYWGWTGDSCYYDGGLYGADCDGSGACRSAALDCTGATQGADTGIARSTCTQTSGCTGTTPPSVSNVANGSDPAGDCTSRSCQSAGRYAGWSGNSCYYDGASYGANCDGSGSCRSVAQDCTGVIRGAATGPSRSTCQVSGGCTGTTAPTLSNATNGTDPYGDCGSRTCQSAGRYSGWSGNTCYYDGGSYGANCNGSGSCRTASQDCTGTRGASSGTTRTTCRTPGGCTGTTAPTLGYVASGSDTYGDCASATCQSAGYYYGWSGRTCYYRAGSYGANCNGSGSCRTAANDCPSQGRGNSTGTSRPICRTASGCSGTSGPVIGSYVSQGTNTYSDCGPSTEYTCNGSGSCCFSTRQLIRTWGTVWRPCGGTTQTDSGNLICSSLGSGNDYSRGATCSYRRVGTSDWCTLNFTRTGCNTFGWTIHSCAALPGVTFGGSVTASKGPTGVWTLDGSATSGACGSLRFY
ncbi:MAG: hypothetical protein OEY14_06910, partial [Myxococcales bacterium]|nr:hypothetical protein [Myxococcales bacterium]